LLLFACAILFAGLLAGFLFALTPGRTFSAAALPEPAMVALACWAIAFAAPFIAEAGAKPVDTAMAAVALSAFVLGVAVVSRRTQPLWGAYFGGVLFAGAIWAVCFGIYAEHALGWQGLELADIEDVGDLWTGAFFFAPTAALPGALVGVIGSMMWRRARVSAASLTAD
jgi:hypothetical protein